MAQNDRPNSFKKPANILYLPKYSALTDFILYVMFVLNI